MSLRVIFKARKNRIEKSKGLDTKFLKKNFTRPDKTKKYEEL